MMTLPCLADLLPSLKGKEKGLFLTGLVFGLLVMLSRILVGAHFISDVSMGAFIGTVFCMVWLKFCKKS